MRDSTYRMTLDIHHPASQIQVTAKRGDTSRKLIIAFTEDGEPYLLKQGMRAVIMITKTGGTTLFNDCDIDLINGVAVYEFTAQTASAVGINECEVRLYSGYNDLLTSPRFTILVDDTVYDDGQIKSVSEYLTLTNAINGANNLDMDVSKSGEDTTITITKKDGTQKTEHVYDGHSPEVVGAATYIDHIYATVTGEGDAPAVDVEYEGTDEHRDLTFNFSGIKGDRGASGVYVGGGDMPEDCNVQIDPYGDSPEIKQATGQSIIDVMSQKAITDAIDAVNSSKQDKLTDVNLSGTVSATLADGKWYNCTGVTSLTFVGSTTIACAGRVTFSGSPTISITGITGSSGDAVSGAAANEVWEFNLLKGYMIWKKMS